MCVCVCHSQVWSFNTAYHWLSLSMVHGAWYDIGKIVGELSVNRSMLIFLYVNSVLLARQAYTSLGIGLEWLPVLECIFAVKVLLCNCPLRD